MKKYILILAITLSGYIAAAQTIWTIGPMMHVNIGGEKTRVSWGVETAYWNFNGFPYSVDLALEFSKQRIRFYSELQTGIGIAGISAGPVFQLKTDESKFNMGFQASIWGNYYLGVDLRMLFIDNEKYFCPGLYAKTGVAGRHSNGDKMEPGGWEYDDDGDFDD